MKPGQPVPSEPPVASEAGSVDRQGEIAQDGAHAARPTTTRDRSHPMEFFVYSRGAIERLAPHDVPHVIVSITTTADDRAKLPPSPMCHGVLRLVFPDADPSSENASSALFSSAQADEILDFVERHQTDVVRIVLHCDAGVSRSPAVAAALALRLGQDDSEFFRRYRPNMHVYRTILDAWQERVGGDSGDVGAAEKEPRNRS